MRGSQKRTNARNWRNMPTNSACCPGNTHQLVVWSMNPKALYVLFWRDFSIVPSDILRRTWCGTFCLLVVVVRCFLVIFWASVDNRQLPHRTYYASCICSCAAVSTSVWERRKDGVPREGPTFSSWKQNFIVVISEITRIIIVIIMITNQFRTTDGQSSPLGSYPGV